MKFILSSIFCLIISFLQAQNIQSFEIIEVKTDKIYLNFIQYNEKLYIGTNDGLVEIDSKKSEVNINSGQRGYILLENNKIIGNKLSAEYNNNDNQYNFLLPNKYKNSSSRASIYNKKLYIINSGILFIFKQNNYSSSFDSLSVRSITQNYIGSYQGIFKNGQKLKYPEFTDGNIREFNNETIICYGGIYRDSSGIISIYNNIKNGEVSIGNKELGSARDILKLDNGNYALVTNTGIYLVNFANKKVINVQTSSNIFEYFNVFQLNKKDNFNDRFYFTNNDKIYNYVVTSNEKVLIIDTKNKNLIKDVYAENLSNVYVLFEDKFVKYTRNNKTTQFDENVLINKMSFAHNVVLFKNIFCITTNVGTHLYDLKTNKSYLNVIPFETNRRSLAVINDTVKFGTTNGIINLTESDISSIINEKDTQPLTTYSLSSEIKTYIIVFLIVAIIVLVFFGFRFYNNKISKSIETTKDNVLTKENIVQFIHTNITNVTIQSICDKFGVTPVRLYELLENDKPGEIIRNHRLNLVRRYRREKKDDTFIAENTGFSISYLKKIY